MLEQVGDHSRAQSTKNTKMRKNETTAIHYIAIARFRISCKNLSRKNANDENCQPK